MHRPETEADSAPVPRHRVPVRLLRKIGVAVVGAGLIAAGVAMLVLPGPGIVAILAGLGLLGTEFPRARRISERVNGYARAAWRQVRTRMGRGRAA
ncbi:PGPGW domain-containing protein [Spirillospora sp. NPDC048823]|uniref:PGPGW domain-containing protein n=1 Tax=unclassified Spirillospora TaxID=2642701 RepID=UPI0037249D66